MKLPNYVVAALNSASGLSKCYINNSKASQWLCNKLGLVTDDNEHDLGDYIVDFCWKTQKWYVK
jgi:hypothetical protein